MVFPFFRNPKPCVRSRSTNLDLGGTKQIYSILFEIFTFNSILVTMPSIMAGMPHCSRIDRPKARGTQDLFVPNRKKVSHSRQRACAVNIKAFKENTKIQDWRINEMVQVRFGCVMTIAGLQLFVCFAQT